MNFFVHMTYQNLNQGAIKNLNRSWDWSSNKSLPTEEIPEPDEFTEAFDQNFKEQLILIILKLFNKTENGDFQTLFMKLVLPPKR